MAFRVAPPPKNEMERIIYKETEWVGEHAHEASNVPLNPRSKEIMMTFQSSVVYIVIICMHQLKVVPLGPIHWRVCCCGYTVKGIVIMLLCLFSPLAYSVGFSLSFPLPVCNSTMCASWQVSLGLWGPLRSVPTYWFLLNSWLVHLFCVN